VLLSCPTSWGEHANHGLFDAFLLRDEVHGAGPESRHLCMAVPNNSHYQSCVTGNPVRPEARVDATGLGHAPTEPGVDLPDVAEEQLTHSVRQASERSE
jgi:hypothetical protein